MSMMSRKLIKDLLDAFKAAEKNKTTGYDTAATVKRIENGIAWVHIPGGVDETPAKLTINANVGDIVQVRVSGGKAFLIGNGSAPPTDDTTAIKATRVANKAHRTALQASEEATEAWNYAGTAAEAAISAQTSADSASQAADRAWEHADEANQAATEAKASAISANNSANNALVQLSVVEDVAGTLRWISEHGDYVLTEDTTVQEGTVYFVKQGGDYIPIASPDPTKNPKAEGWYVLDVTESQSKYIMAHLAVTSAGLWVLPVDQLVSHPLTDSEGNQLVDSNDDILVDFSQDPQYSAGYKVLLSGGERIGEVTFPIGLTIYNDEGEAVANYGIETTIGKESENNVNIADEGIYLRYMQTVLASFSSQDGIILGEHQDIHIGNVSGGTVRDLFEVGETLTFTLSHELDAIVSVDGFCIDSTTGDVVIKTLTAADYSVSGNDITFSSPLVSDPSLTPSNIFVDYTTAETITQMSIGKNANTDNAKNRPLVIGNNNESIDPSNVFGISWAGEIYARNHEVAIGEIKEAVDGFNTTLIAGIDSFDNYSRLWLRPGIYVVTAKFNLAPSTTSTGCVGLRICKDSPDASHVISSQRQLANVNTSYQTAISHSCIVSITSNTILYAVASCHYGGTISAGQFRAVCIS